MFSAFKHLRIKNCCTEYNSPWGLSRVNETLLKVVVITHTLDLGFGSAQVSCYPWGCGYTVKEFPPGKIIGYN